MSHVGRHLVERGLPHPIRDVVEVLAGTERGDVNDQCTCFGAGREEQRSDADTGLVRGSCPDVDDVVPRRRRQFPEWGPDRGPEAGCGEHAVGEHVQGLVVVADPFDDCGEVVRRCGVTPNCRCGAAELLDLGDGCRYGTRLIRPRLERATYYIDMSPGGAQLERDALANAA